LNLAAHPTLAWADICFSANTGRSHFNHRLGVVASSVAQARDKLTAFIEGQTAISGVFQNTVTPHKLAFLFTGLGSEYINMGRQLYETQPTFRQSLDRCDEILGLEKPLLSVFSEQMLNETALFALEYALAKLWQSWGIEPDVVMGHSVGEYVAACIAGVFSLEDGLKLIAAQAEFERIAAEVTYATPQIPLCSNGQLVRDDIATPAYWSRLMRQPVRFAARLCLPEGVGTLLVSLRQGEPDWQQLLQSLGELYVRGVSVDWSGFDQDYSRMRIELPTYPFQRQRYWIDFTKDF